LAVYERTYKGYDGDLTKPWARFLVLPRYSLRLVFSSRLFLGYFILTFVPALVLASIVYISHNLTLLEKLGIGLGDLALVDAGLFWNFLSVQTILTGFILVLVVAPQLVAADLANNALPLYLARPFHRAEYVLGKMSVLLILLSSVTWIPYLLIFFLQSYMAGWDWFQDNYRIGFAIFLYSWSWILTMSLIGLSLSALFRNKRVIRVGLFALFFIFGGFGAFLAEGLDQVWGYNLNIFMVLQRIGEFLFGLPPEITAISPASAVATLLFLGGLSVWILARKIRAYQEVR